MKEVELLEAKDALAASGQFPARRQAGNTQADDDDIHVQIWGGARRGTVGTVRVGHDGRKTFHGLSLTVGAFPAPQKLSTGESSGVRACATLLHPPRPSPTSKNFIPNPSFLIPPAPYPLSFPSTTTRHCIGACGSIRTGGPRNMPITSALVRVCGVGSGVRNDPPVRVSGNNN